MAVSTNSDYRPSHPRKYGFGGGLAVGSLVGAYIGYKVGRAVGTRKGGVFDTEKKIGKSIKGAFTKKKYAGGGGVDLFSMSKTINDRGQISEMVIAENVSVEEFNKLFSDKGYRKVYDKSLVGFYFAKPNGDTIQLIPSFHKKGEIVKYAGGGGVNVFPYSPMDRYNQIRYFMKSLGFEVDDIQPTDNSVGISNGWVTFTKQNDKTEALYEISYDDLTYYIYHNGTREDILKDSFLVDEDEYAGGGSIQDEIANIDNRIYNIEQLRMNASEEDIPYYNRVIANMEQEKRDLLNPQPTRKKLFGFFEDGGGIDDLVRG